MSCKPIKLSIFLLSASVLHISPALATAAPVINDYTINSGSSGNTMVLKGSGFTQGPDVVLYDNFDGRVSGETVNLEDPLIGQWGASYSNPRYIIENDGNGGFLARNFDVSSGSQLAQLQALFNRLESEIFYSFSVKVPEGFYFSGASSPDSFPSASSWKFSWLYSGEQGFKHDDGLFDVAVPTHVGSGTFMIAGNSGALAYINSGDQWWDWHSFNHIGFYMKMADDAETSDTINWKIRVASSNNNIIKDGHNPITSYQGTDYLFDRLNFPGWWGNGDSSNFSAIYDNVYIATGENANSRIVVSDHENIDQSSNFVTLPPKSWSDTQVELDFSLLPSWQQVYVHIVDTNGQFTPKGIQVCRKCPSPIAPSIK